MNRLDLSVLMISTDRQILTPGSAVCRRMVEYGGLVEELHVVLLCDKKHGLKNSQIGQNVWVYPTNSLNKFLRPISAVRVGSNINCDLITAQDPFECGWVGMKLKFIKSVPLEVQLHTDPYATQFKGLLNFIRKLIAKLVLNHADGIRVVSGGVRAKLKHPNTYALPIYVDKSKIAGEPQFDLHEKFGFKSVVLAVSRLSEEKNIGLAIEAVSKIPDAGLVIVGDGPERNRFKETEGVKFVGWQEDLASYYKTADVFIQTSKFEGYGLSLVEAGLSGLPVVTTPVGIAHDLENVRIARTAEEFERTISNVLAHNPRQLGAGLKSELESKILNKEEFLSRLAGNWGKLTHKQ